MALLSFGRANIALSDLISSSIFLDKADPIGVERSKIAEVAELVDALGSGSSGCTPVLVQIQSSAPFKNQGVSNILLAPFSLFKT